MALLGAIGGAIVREASRMASAAAETAEVDATRGLFGQAERARTRAATRMFGGRASANDPVVTQQEVVPDVQLAPPIEPVQPSTVAIGATPSPSSAPVAAGAPAPVSAQGKAGAVMLSVEDMDKWCGLAQDCVAEIGRIRADKGTGEQSLEEKVDQQAAAAWLPEVSRILVALKLQNATSTDLERLNAADTALASIGARRRRRRKRRKKKKKRRRRKKKGGPSLFAKAKSNAGKAAAGAKRAINKTNRKFKAAVERRRDRKEKEEEEEESQETEEFVGSRVHPWHEHLRALPKGYGEAGHE